MIDFDEIILANNLNWSQMYDHPYRIIIITSSSSGETNALLNLICN